VPAISLQPGAAMNGCVCILTILVNELLRGGRGGGGQMQFYVVTNLLTYGRP
jgi:hypothetical protein